MNKKLQLIIAERERIFTAALNETEDGKSGIKN